MLIEDVKTSFEIHFEEYEQWEKRPHKHNFFEIVYIEEGNGKQCINQHEFEYSKGNVFFLPPLDCHSFKIEEKSKFYFIRFTDHFFLDSSNLANYKSWFDRIAYVLANYNKVPGDIIHSETDRSFIIQTLKSIYTEYSSSDRYSDSIITGALASILSILARNIELQYVEQASKVEDGFGEVLRFIHTNLLEQYRLKIPYLSNEFNISPTYFSEYFKKHSGMSLSEYITKSKLKLAETKIRHSDLTVKEIAYQLNFSDSSHFSKAFKKRYGVTVKEYRRQEKERLRAC